jgi:hypothetical protein
MSHTLPADGTHPQWRTYWLWKQIEVAYLCFVWCLGNAVFEKVWTMFIGCIVVNQQVIHPNACSQASFKSAAKWKLVCAVQLEDDSQGLVHLLTITCTGVNRRIKN